jgi:hypothetical protein
LPCPVAAMPVSCISVADVRGLALGLPVAPLLLVVPLLVPGEPALELIRPLLLICRFASTVGAAAGGSAARAPLLEPMGLAEAADPLDPSVPPAPAECAARLHVSKSACVGVRATASVASATKAAVSIVMVVRVKLAITDSSCERCTCRRRTCRRTRVDVQAKCH